MDTSGCVGHGSQGTCERCGTFICRNCRRWLREKAHCLECFERMGHKPSARASIALALSSVGLALLLPGFAGAIVGFVELRAIERGSAPPAGESFARAAIGLGVLEGLLFVVLLVSWLR